METWRDHGEDSLERWEARAVMRRALLPQVQLRLLSAQRAQRDEGATWCHMVPQLPTPSSCANLRSPIFIIYVLIH